MLYDVEKVCSPFSLEIVYDVLQHVFADLWKMFLFCIKNPSDILQYAFANLEKVSYPSCIETLTFSFLHSSFIRVCGKITLFSLVTYFVQHFKPKIMNLAKKYTLISSFVSSCIDAVNLYFCMKYNLTKYKQILNSLPSCNCCDNYELLIEW